MGRVFIFFKSLGSSIYKMLTNKLLMMILVLCLGMALLQVSSDFREKIIEQDLEMDKDNKDISYYYDDIDRVEYVDNVAIDRMIECYQDSTNLDDVPDSVINLVNKLEELYRGNSRYFSFIYQDLFSGFTVSYNADKPIFTASTIKAPAMIYIYETASLGNIDLNEYLVYTSNYYSGGTGVLKNKSVNTSYTIEELIQYTIYDSDNIAYKMLMDRYGRVNILGFWRERGSKYIFENNTVWGYLSADDALIYMRELYNFSRKNSEYGTKLLNHFKKAKFKLVTDKMGNYDTANKSGWSGTAIHDVAIVFDENPYVLAILSNLGESSYNYLFSETSRLVGELHENYWKYKVDICSNIKLY